MRASIESLWEKCKLTKTHADFLLIVAVDVFDAGDLEAARIVISGGAMIGDLALALFATGAGAFAGLGAAFAAEERIIGVDITTSRTREHKIIEIDAFDFAFNTYDESADEIGEIVIVGGDNRFVAKQ